MVSRTGSEKALEEMRNGRPVVVTDDGDRENEGDLILRRRPSPSRPWPLWCGTRRASYVLLCTGEDLDQVKTGPMVSKNEDPKRHFAVTVDLKDGVTAGYFRR